MHGTSPSYTWLALLQILCWEVSVELPLLHNLLKALNLVALFEIGPVVEAHTTFTALAHFSHVLLHVLQRVKFT